MKAAFIAFVAFSLYLSAVGANKKPLTKEESAKVIEAAIRKELKKPEGELTEVDYEKVTKLYLGNKQLTDVQVLEKLGQLRYLALPSNKLTDLPKGLDKLKQLKQLYLFDNQLTNLRGLEKLDQLELLSLEGNPALTKAQISELQKALPKCKITHNLSK